MKEIVQKRWTLYLYWGLLTFVVVCFPAQAEPLPLSGTVQTLTPHLEQVILPEAQSEPPFSALLKAEVQPASQQALNPGFSLAPHWFRFQLQNTTDAPVERYLELAHPNIDEVWFFREVGDRAYQKTVTGRHYPFSRREVAHRHFVFPLHLPAQSTRTYYFRLQSTSAYYVAADLYTSQAFVHKERDAQLGFGFYYGLIFVMFFYNLVLWLSTRSKSYLYYVLTVFFLHGLFQLSSNGLAYEYLWPNAVWWNNHCLGFFLGVSVFWVLQFTQRFLKTQHEMPRMHRFFNGLKYTSFLMAIFNLFPEHTWFSQLSIYWNIRIALLSNFLIWGVALWRWREANARSFLIAWSTLLLGGLITGLVALNLLPRNFWTIHALQMGTAIQVVLLSLALAERMRTGQMRVLAAEQARVAEAQDAQRVQTELVQQLQKLDRLKDDFMANISHELRTPLNGIIGISESLIDGAAGPLAPPQQKNLALVVASARRLFHLVSDLLDFSQIKHRQIQLQSRAVWLREVVEVVLRLSEPLIGQKPVQLQNEVPQDLPPVWADEDRLQQILHNLVGNAIKFTASGHVRVSALVEGDQVEIRVKDSGMGIDPAQQERIFEAFEQADGSITRSHSGTGLGLAITRQLLQLQQGDIHVESTPGAGATFVFTLPLAHEQEVSPVVAMTSPAELLPLRENESRSQKLQTQQLRQLLPGTQELDVADLAQADTLSQLELPGIPEDRSFHILIVDDEPVNLQVLVNMLSLQNYTVTRADSGQAALKALEQQTFDLILLDVMMPHMSGYEVCAAIRERYPASALPVVFLTARSQTEDVVHGFETGANDYLSKPVAKNELLARIQTHIRLSKLNVSYARFVPDEFLQYLGYESILDVKLGDQVQEEMTVMFADIRSFTTLSEQLTPKENFDFLNDYLSRISPVIRIHKGFIDKYIGDGIMALFPHRAQEALDAALEMFQELASYNVERQAVGYIPIQIGIGLHTGLLMLGTIGESERMEGTVISDAVNTAARMEGLTKLYGASIIVSQHTLAELTEPEKYAMRYLGEVRVKGKQERTAIYEVLEPYLCPDYAARYRSIEDFEAAVRAYFKRDLETARQAFAAIVKRNPKDAAARYYQERCVQFLQQGLPEDVSPTFV